MSKGWVSWLGTKIWYQGWVPILGLKDGSQHWVLRLGSNFWSHSSSIKVAIHHQSLQLPSPNKGFVDQCEGTMVAKHL